MPLSIHLMQPESFKLLPIFTKCKNRSDKFLCGLKRHVMQQTIIKLFKQASLLAGGPPTGAVTWPRVVLMSASHLVQLRHISMLLSSRVMGVTLLLYECQYLG